MANESIEEPSRGSNWIHPRLIAISGDRIGASTLDRFRRIVKFTPRPTRNSFCLRLKMDACDVVRLGVMVPGSLSGPVSQASVYATSASSSKLPVADQRIRVGRGSRAVDHHDGRTVGRTAGRRRARSRALDPGSAGVPPGRSRDRSWWSLLRLRLLQPEPHAHLAVHRRRGGEVLVGLIAFAGARGRASRGRGGSGRRAGACRAARRGPAPGGSGPRRSRHRIGWDGSRCHRAGATQGP